MTEPNPETSPIRRSDATKAAILAAAREQFAANGYQGATIRGIATSAGIDPAMVMRYFGNKEGLFAAAAEFDLRLPDPAEVPRERLAETYVEHFLDRWEEDDTLMALMRTAATSDVAAQRMQEVFTNQVAAAVQKMTGEPKAQAQMRAGLVASQMLGLALCRYVLKLPPVVAMKRAEIVRRVAPVIRGYLTQP